MNIYTAISDLPNSKKPIDCAIGVFDGVHPGHRAVIRHALDQAKQRGGEVLVITFDPHPQQVLHPATAPNLLTTRLHKIRLLEEMGVQHLLIIPFTKEFAATEPERFIEQLCMACPNLRGITVGYGWRFGRGGRGDIPLLHRLGERFGFDVHGVAPVSLEGVVISSTLIRQAVHENNLQHASALLGRSFSFLGRVGHGLKLGRKLGFPTANFTTEGIELPPNGIYTAYARYQQQMLRGVLNLGIRPTLEGIPDQRLLELHLLDFEGDLYEKEIEVIFHEFLREELKFPSLDDLKTQIRKDVEQARKRLI